MHVGFLDLAAATAELRPELDAAVARVLDGGRYVLGAEVEAFEAEWASFCGARHAVGVGSGLDALTLSLRASGIGAGDEVIVPAQTFVATWLAVSATGATPVGADVLDENAALDPRAVAAAVTPRTRAVVVVHLFGAVAAMSALRALCSRAGLLLVEDAAQAHGAAPLGGDVACWSFYPGKNLGALGDAGAITTNDPALADRVRLLRNYGSRVKYEHETAGVNSRLDELQAAVLRVKLEALPAWNARRASVAQRYAGLSALPASTRSSWHLFPIRVPDGRRDAAAEALGAQGVETLAHYPTIPSRTGAYDRPPGEFPVAEAWAREELSLPIGPHLPLDAADHVREVVAAAFDAAPVSAALAA